MGNYNTSKWQQALHLRAVITSCVALFSLFIIIIILVISQRHLVHAHCSRHLLFHEGLVIDYYDKIMYNILYC